VATSQAVIATVTVGHSGAQLRRGSAPTGTQPDTHVPCTHLGLAGVGCVTAALVAVLAEEAVAT